MPGYFPVGARYSGLSAHPPGWPIYQKDFAKSAKQHEWRSICEYLSAQLISSSYPVLLAKRSMSFVRFFLLNWGFFAVFWECRWVLNSLPWTVRDDAITAICFHSLYNSGLVANVLKSWHRIRWRSSVSLEIFGNSYSFLRCWRTRFFSSIWWFFDKFKRLLTFYLLHFDANKW